MAAASYGLRHPASASCLGRHLRLAGRCPNNSSLFPPLAAVVVVALCASSAERIFIISQFWKICGFSRIAFSREGSWRKTAAAALAPPGGAVAQRLRGYKWRSEKSVKAIAPTGAALAFLCFDFFFRIVKGVQPLATGCGTQHPLRALGGTRVLLAAAPTTPPCFRHWRRSSSLLGIFSGKTFIILGQRSVCGRSAVPFSRKGLLRETDCLPLRLQA